eukprot:6200564-Pyramimonas_sp.AAC.1
MCACVCWPAAQCLQLGLVRVGLPRSSRTRLAGPPVSARWLIPGLLGPPGWATLRFSPPPAAAPGCCPSISSGQF